MKKAQQTRFDSLYQQHVNALKRQGKSKMTIQAYARAVRRITTFFDRCPDQLSLDDLKEYFTSLISSHSWSTVKVDRNGLLLFPAGKNIDERTQAIKPMNRTGLQRAFKKIARGVGIHKQVHIHTLRHSYGAYLVEHGLHLRALQEELGHACPTTTALYTQLTRPTMQNTLDLINTMVSKLTITLDGEV